jgi:hypothetical protein
MQFYCQNTIRPKKDTKLCLRVENLDASYQISDQLALQFQRRRLKCENLTDDGRQTPSDGKSSHCLWQGELIQDAISTYGNQLILYNGI